MPDRAGCKPALPDRSLSAHPKGCSRIASKSEASQLPGRVRILGQRQDLKTSAEHFRMEQGLQSATRFGIRLIQQLGPLRNNPGQEMMLIGEPGRLESPLLRPLDDACPFDMRSDVASANFRERRVDQMMGCPALKCAGGSMRSVKVRAGKSVIDGQDKAAL